MRFSRLTAVLPMDDASPSKRISSVAQTGYFSHLTGRCSHVSPCVTRRKIFIPKTPCFSRQTAVLMFHHASPCVTMRKRLQLAQKPLFQPPNHRSHVSPCVILMVTHHLFQNRLFQPPNCRSRVGRCVTMRHDEEDASPFSKTAVSAVKLPFSCGTMRHDEDDASSVADLCCCAAPFSD